MVEDLTVGYVNARVFTSPHSTPDLDPKPALLALLTKAKHSILFATYSFTLVELAKAIIAAHNKGLTVRGVGDASTWHSATSQLPLLAAAGVDIRQWGGNYRLMHDKVCVVDGDAVAIGSYNWTSQAEKVNVEVLLIASGAQVGRVLAPTLTTQIQNVYDQGVFPS